MQHAEVPFLIYSFFLEGVSEVKAGFQQAEKVPTAEGMITALC